MSGATQGKALLSSYHHGVAAYLRLFMYVLTYNEIWVRVYHRNGTLSEVEDAV